MSTNFATRYKKDLSTATLKTKLVRRKSVFQKESRHNEFNKGRQFGLIDANIQSSRGKELSRLEETGEGYSSKSKGKSSQIPIAASKTRGQERLEMLQRYKAEKELRKLKEQRDKPIFKCGRFKPEDPGFLSKASQIPLLSKPKEKEAPPVVRMTRSRTKNQLQEPVGPSTRSHLSATFSGSRLQTGQHIHVDKPPRKENKEVQPAVSTTTSGRTTRATAAAKTKIPQVSRPAVIAGNLPQKRIPQKGKQQKGVKNEGTTALHGMKENPLIELVKEEAKPQSATDTEQDVAFLEKENLPASPIPASAPSKRTRSFAPQNFVFQPLEGLTTYKVKPMSPSRVDVFLSPNLFWNSAQTTSKAPEEDTKEPVTQDYGLNNHFSAAPEVTKEVLQECQSALEFLEAKTECVSNEMRDAVPAEREISLLCADPPAMATSDLTGELQHDVPYFRNILRSETERLASCCLEWDGTAEMDIPEDAKDLVRTTIGQTRLLIAERFKQFEGLVDNCEFGRGEKETTCTDLDGFWDMVDFQVEDVNKKFENLRKLQMNGWQMIDDVQAKRPAKKKAAPQRANKAQGGSAKRAAARKRVAAIKAAVKNKLKQEGLAKEATGQEMPTEAEKVMFDARFFHFNSPAKPFAGRTPKSVSRSSRRISRRATPRSAHKALLQSCAETCVVRLSTPSASQAVPSVPDLNACLDPGAPGLLGSVSEQSDIQAAEELRTATEELAEETTDSRANTCDRGSPSSDNGLAPVRCQGLESPSVIKEEPEIEEEMEEAVADLEEQGVLCTPKKDSQSEGICSPELHTPEGLLLSNFSCDDGPLDLQQPHPDTSLFFTPLGNEAAKIAAGASSNDLIVFSPLPLPDGEK
ncbi:disks large-associated protein 5 [Elgaria multicarinata webbii]|uniref:disks large-associated protein 5 n=1 Tax=Elgaria multicarinata webbii TaxID=159646 RepID=UPI002FCCD573